MDSARGGGSGASVERALRMLLNERYLLVKRTEREGFRKALIACGIFVGYKFIKYRFLGGRTDDKAM
jgi:hypothetical protein